MDNKNFTNNDIKLSVEEHSLLIRLLKAIFNFFGTIFSPKEVAALENTLLESKHYFSEIFENGTLEKLRIAFTQKDTQSIIKIMKDDPIFNKGNIAGFTPLHLACHHGSFELVKLLVESNITDVNASTTITEIMTGMRPLHKAVLYGHIDIVEFLLQHGADPKLCTDKDGWGLLHTAARDGYTEIVKFLIEYGLDVNQPSTNGTALDLAIRYNNTSTVELLIANGAINSTLTGLSLGIDSQSR